MTKPESRTFASDFVTYAEISSSVKDNARFTSIVPIRVLPAVDRLLRRTMVRTSVARSATLDWDNAFYLLMKVYRGFPRRLHHEVPHWVESGALFHIRVALERSLQQRRLTDAHLASVILESARFYESKQRWYINLFVLMPITCTQSCRSRATNQ